MADTRMISVTVPEGVAPGSTLEVQDPSTGQQMQVQVPATVKPGETFQVQLPKLPTATVVQAAPPIATTPTAVQMVPPQPVHPVQPGFVQPQPTVGQTVGVPVQPRVQMPIGHHPVHVVCPHCSTYVQTRVVKNAGLCTWLSCLGLACVGCVYGCCLIPFCVDDCKDSKHYCPSCGALIASRPVVG